MAWTAGSGAWETGGGFELEFTSELEGSGGTFVALWREIFRIGVRLHPTAMCERRVGGRARERASIDIIGQREKKKNINLTSK